MNACHSSKSPSCRSWFIALYKIYLHVFDRGSLGPSTVTLIAFVYVATCGGLDDIVMVIEKLLPAKWKWILKLIIIRETFVWKENPVPLITFHKTEQTLKGQ